MATIGISGHRIIRDIKKVTQAVDYVLRAIHNHYPSDSYLVISPLAEGADRLVARRAIELLSARLIVPLPLETDDYLQDFNTAASREEFQNLIILAEQVVQLPPEDARHDSYLAAGLYVLNLCDVLIAVWDGLPARGIGGTGQIVELARKQNKPIAWVQIDHSGYTVTGKPNIHYERFPLLGTKAREP
jgi:hypothetical protein